MKSYTKCNILTRLPGPSRGCNVGVGDIGASWPDALGRSLGWREGTAVNQGFELRALVSFPLTLFFDIDADRPEVGSVEEAVVGAGEAHDGRRVDVVLEHQPLGTLVRHVGPRGNGGRDPCHSKSN